MQEYENVNPQEIAIVCSRCKTIPDEYLQMDCGHHICLDCAKAEQDVSKAILKETNISNGAISLKCDLCGHSTILHEKTVEYIDNHSINKNDYNQFLQDQITEADIKAETESNNSKERETGYREGSTNMEYKNINSNFPRTSENLNDAHVIFDDNLLTKSSFKKTTDSLHESLNRATLKQANSLTTSKNGIKNAKKISRASSNASEKKSSASHKLNNKVKTQKWEENTKPSDYFAITNDKPNLRNFVTSSSYKGGKAKKIVEKTLRGSKEKKEAPSNQKKLVKKVKTLKTDPNVNDSSEKRLTTSKTIDSLKKEFSKKASEKDLTEAYLRISIKNKETSESLTDNKQLSRALEESIKKKSKSPEKKERRSKLNDNDEVKSTQSGLQRKATKKAEAQDRERVNKSVNTSKSPKAHYNENKFLSSKQKLEMDAIKQSNDFRMDIDESLKTSLKKKSLSPKKAPTLEDLKVLLNDIDSALNHCDKLLSQELLIESQLKQNYWSVGNLVKKTFGNFVNYVKHKEKETMKKLDESYQQNLSEFKDGARCCTMFTGRFKQIAENMREAVKFGNFELEKFLTQSRVDQTHKEIVLSNYITLETAKSIQTTFFEQNRDLLNVIENTDNKLKVLFDYPNYTLDTDLMLNDMQNKLFGEKVEKSFKNTSDLVREITDASSMKKNLHESINKKNNFEASKNIVKEENIKNKVTFHGLKKAIGQRNAANCNYREILAEARKVVFKDDFSTGGTNLNQIWPSQTNASVTTKNDQLSLNYNSMTLPHKSQSENKSNTNFNNKPKISPIEAQNNKIFKLLEKQDYNFQVQANYYNSIRGPN